MKRRIGKVALFSPYDGGNLGDAAILRALIDNLRSRSSHIDLVGITLDAGSMQKTHGIPGTVLFITRREFYGGGSGAAGGESGFRALLRPLRMLSRTARMLLMEARHWLHAIRFLRDVDVLVVAGGGQFDEEWGGPWGQPYALFKWSSAARLTGTRVACLSVGICRLQSRLGHFFISRTLSRASYVSYRDPWSLEFAMSQFPGRTASVVPDLALSLKWSRSESSLRASGVCGIGVSPIAYGRPDLWPTKDHSAFQNYIRALTEFVAGRLEHGDRVVLFCSDGPDWRIVEEMCEALRSRCSAEAISNLSTVRPRALLEVLGVISECDVIIASRLHGVILSHLLAKPTVAISYDRKVSTHMQQIGETAACIELAGLDAGDLARTFTALASQRAAVSDRLRATVETWQNDLGTQYDHVLSELVRAASSQTAGGEAGGAGVEVR